MLAGHQPTGAVTGDASERSELQVRWHGVPPDALAWRDWGGEVVLFNQETGSTHLIGEFAAEILRCLASSADGATIETLAVDLADDTHLAANGDWTEAIAEALHDFARLGLARREPW